MDTSCPSPVDLYLADLTSRAVNLRLPDLLLQEQPDAFYQQRNRHGISVIALRTSSMTEEQIDRILEYRLGQYLHTSVGMLNAEVIHAAGWQREPRSETQPNDIHVIAGAAETGQILCYAVVRSLPATAPGTTLRSRSRPFFQVEKTHGWGIFNRLLTIPDLPIENVRECGRFIKNHGAYTFDELGARAPVEVGVALYRTLSGSLRGEVVGVVGDLEESVAKQNLDFFHVPAAIIHGTLPYAPETSFAFDRYQYREIFPFATLTADLDRCLERLDAIERALELPGKQGLAGLFRLKRDIRDSVSSLEPPDGLMPLAKVRIDQRELPMATRREMHSVGGWLRGIPLFSGFSDAEAALLGTFMEARDASPGDVIIRQGDPGSDLYLIEAGQAEVLVHTRDGQTITVACLGPGDYFGEICLLTGGERTADVVALSELELRRLTKEAYTEYLAQLAEVDRPMSEVAASRRSETSRLMSPGDSAASAV